MSAFTVGIGEWKVSSDPEAVIKTFALGSCVAVIIYDSKRKIGGLIHVALPDSSIDAARGRSQPGYFADVGLPLMIEEMKKLGVDRAHVWVKLAGGAAMLDPAGLFDIGKRNILAVKRVLWRSSLGPLAEHTGGEISRTVSLSVADGATVVSSGSQKWEI
jgi:chemotaxis protein CheD